MIKKTTLLLALCSISSIAFAHTTITKNAMGGHSAFTAFHISHGCGFAGKPTLGVIAMSVVFPNGPDAIVTRADTGQPVVLGDVLGGVPEWVTGLISPTIIQNHDVFTHAEPQTDSSELIRGVHYSDGYMNPALDAIIPFSLAGPSFNEESCATKVTLHIAIANWCHHRAGNRRVDVWMGELTPVFNDGDVVTAAVHFWPTMTINRNLEANPLPDSCGEGFEVTVQPSKAAIDQYLPMEGFIPGGPTEGGGGEE